ncbi:MAG TPA: endonuclease/exonuclease/phosphatase family protein [Pyrinomonadaceae bacterium]|nr:endonuclease/exonuclease/phosphatase family protein [Pyrinomonadaceae bacterium]
MSETGSRVRIATYNVHKCRGMDRRVRPGRVASVLREVGADIVALQEVVSVEDTRTRERHQAHFIAEELGLHCRIGENRRHDGGAYGNVVLSRWPFRHSHNYDITWRGREPRGALRVDVEVEAAGGARHLLHVFNIHMGTAYIERRFQGRRLVSPDILCDETLRAGSRVVLGDFNEWTRGLATRLLGQELVSADLREHLPRARTYPGVLPFLHLDHIYFDRTLRLERLWLHRGLNALVASDHLPLVADFVLPETEEVGG